MKVITEKRLRQWKRISREMGLFGIKSMEMLGHIIKECQEIDQLTVSKLRPMSDIELYEGSDILVFHKQTKRFVHAAYLNHMEG